MKIKSEQRVTIYPYVGAQYHSATIHPVDMSLTMIQVTNDKPPHLWAVSLVDPTTLTLDTRINYQGKQGDNAIHILVREFTDGHIAIKD